VPAHGYIIREILRGSNVTKVFAGPNCPTRPGFGSRSSVERIEAIPKRHFKTSRFAPIIARTEEFADQ